MRKSYQLILIFAIALVFRLLLTTSAYHGDLNNNISWGTLAVEKGLNGFYGSPDANDWPYSAPNQPPLTLLMFTGLRYVWIGVDKFFWWINYDVRLFPSRLVWFWRDWGMTILVKLPSILADLGIGYIIYKYFREKKQLKLGLILSSVWLFNPITWYNSAIWGQTDSIVNLLGLVAVLYLLKKDLPKFSLFFTLSFLFKGSLGIFIPILGVIVLLQKYPVHKWLRAIAYCLMTILLTSIWFHPHWDFLIWFFSLYQTRILPGEIGYLTANAFNFWWLVDPGKVLDGVAYLGLSARMWGILATLVGILGVIFWVLKVRVWNLFRNSKLEIRNLSKNIANIEDKRIFLALSIIALLTFLFMTRIHERYLYPFFPYATILLAFYPQMILIYSILSLTYLLNLYHLFWEPPIPFLQNLFETHSVGSFLALINLLIFIYLIYIIVPKKMRLKSS